MTTDGNPIDAVQEEMSQAQAGQPQAPQYATTDQIDALLQEIKNVSSHSNRGMDSIRRDLTERLDAERAAAEMAKIPEEHREILRPALEQITTLTNKIRALEANGVGTAPAQGGANTGDAALDAYLNGNGLTGNEPGLDWDAYNGDDIQAFYASGRRAVEAKAQANGTPPAAPVTPAPVTPASPPVDGMPNGTAGPTGDDEAYDMFISGQITADEFHQRVGW